MFKDQLIKWCETNKFNFAQPKKNKPKKKKGLSGGEYRDLMGMNKPVYRRTRGGSFRQR